MEKTIDLKDTLVQEFVLNFMFETEKYQKEFFFFKYYKNQNKYEKSNF